MRIICESEDYSLHVNTVAEIEPVHKNGDAQYILNIYNIGTKK